MKHDPPLSVLLIEDDDVDCEALDRGFRAIGEPRCLTVARSGPEALDILYGEHSSLLPRPFLVVLDLNMPGMSGFEFLTELRAHEDTAYTTVFVCTTSDSESDKAGAFAQHIAGYISKARIGTDWERVAGLLKEYWVLTRCPP